ncbi:class I SAM-dependent methyltransferase [Leeia oryzae]|uniref:class I SAM-dependent methyltransferase n=1 Tax=Leeia oryzae TaxID=356662 RepID=UPI00036ED860|nr:class I SAM-dependent methyltransferase [Leeia oryzae]
MTVMGNKEQEVQATSGEALAMVEDTTQMLMPFDEHLIERARSQWQFGDWGTLTDIPFEIIQHHPDRATLALFVAAGHLQSGNVHEAQQLLRLATRWGASKASLARILIAGVHNSLGRASALSGQQIRMLKHFESSLGVGTPGTDIRLLTKARQNEQLLQINAGVDSLLAEPVGVPEGYSVQNTRQKTAACSYCMRVTFRRENVPSTSLGFNSNKPEWVMAQSMLLEYKTENNAPLYMVSNEGGNFEKPPAEPQLILNPDTAYILSGVIEQQGSSKPVVWSFQYAGGKRAESHNITVNNGRFRLAFRTLPNLEAMAIGIRLAGEGHIDLQKTVFTLKEQNNEELIAYFEEKINKLEDANKRSVENSMRQLEACIRLQHYLGDDTILPDMHKWPISPDFGVLLINLIEQNGYDGIIEFGSGTSSLIVAKALERAARRPDSKPVTLLTFDHLEEYAGKTSKLITQSGLETYATVALAPLQAWQASNGEQFSYYACSEAIRQYRQEMGGNACKILVIVDGPPSTTGKHARYPAMQQVLDACNGKDEVAFLMDDYLRKEEQEIVMRWIGLLDEKNIKYEKIEFNNLEKKACLLRLNFGKAEK